MIRFRSSTRTSRAQQVAMRYELSLSDDGWSVVDGWRQQVAEYGGIRFERLTDEEARTMRDLLVDHDRVAADLWALKAGFDGSSASERPLARRA